MQTRVVGTLETARQLAGVEDETWSPPRAPDDAYIPGYLQPSPDAPSFDWTRVDWARWATGAAHGTIGSAWRLTRPAAVVAPEWCAYPTLVPAEAVEADDRYLLDTGTRLILVEEYDPDADERNRALGMEAYDRWVDGWAMRTFQIEDGTSAGIRVHLSTDQAGRRFPPSSFLGLAALVPAAAFRFPQERIRPQPGWERMRRASGEQLRLGF